MNGLGFFHNHAPGDRVGDIAFGDTAHSTAPSRITVHYAGRPFALVNFVQGPKEGLLARLKKAFVKSKRRMRLHAPY